MPWAVAAAAVGAGISAYASGEAADTQADSAKDANALQKYMFDEQVRLQDPWRQAGQGGLNKLSYLMGLSPTGYGSTGGSSGPTMQTEAQIRARLTPSFTTTIPGQPGTPAAPALGSGTGGDDTGGVQGGGGVLPAGGATGPTSSVNEAKLNAAIQAELAKQQAAQTKYNAQAERTANRDPEYGSLLDKFGMDDFKADPGYKFRQQQGLQALQRSASARGGLFSGRAMKDTLRFSQGLASQEYGTAFDRFNVQNANTFNRLASISGVGQTAANQTGAAAQNYGNQAAGNIIGAGNAQAAGQVGMGNAVTGGIGQGYSMYQQNQMMNKLFPSGSGWSPSTAPSNAESYNQPGTDYGQFI